MRNLSTTTLNKIAQKIGIEPISIVRVWWTTDGYIDYADRAIGNVQGKLLTLSDLEDVINVQGNTSSVSVNLTLDDTDGSLKTIFNNTDIHRRRVQILQWFSDIPINEAFVIFEGEIASPVTWHEGDRTLTFDVLSKLYDREVGFSVEEGEFNWAPPEIVGKPWPLIFGTVVGVPAIRVSDVPAGLTGEDLGLTAQEDATKQDQEYSTKLALLLEYAQYCFILATECFAIAQNFYNDMVSDIVGGGSTDWTSEINNWRSQGSSYLSQGNQYLAEQFNMQQEYEQFLEQKAQQDQLRKNQIAAISASRFQQQNIMYVSINGYTYQGYFDAGLFNITQHPSPFSDNYTPAGLTTITDSTLIKKYATELPPNRFIFHQGGSTILVGVNYDCTYIAALGHVTIIGVQAKRNNVLVGVPNNYWSVQHVTNGDLRYTTITLTQPLSSRIDSNNNNEGWQDDLYLNIIGEVPGVATTIIEWLVSNYTPYSCDPTSFAAAAAYINRYPMNFALFDRPNVLKLLSDLAFQSRCALWYNDGKFFIKFLPNQEDPVETITETDIDLNSIEVSYTSTEDLITKFTAEWKPDYSQAQPNKIIYRNNIARYGTVEDSFNFFAYNIQACVQKMMEFWLIRKSNTFKRISFRTFLTKLRIETWDTILLDFNNGLVANSPVPAIVESAKFDTSNWKLVITAWVPVRAGEMTQFDYAFPANLPVEFLYPIPGDPNAGSPTRPSTTASDLTQVQPYNAAQFFDDGRRLPIGDQHDDTNNFEVVVQLDQREIQSGVAPVFGPGVFNQFDISPPIAIDQLNGTEPDQILFGLVRGQLDGTKYNVEIVDTFTGETKTISATQFRINSDDVIPEGTPTVVVRKTIRAADASALGTFTQVPQTQRKYFMQVPVWVRPSSTSGSVPEIPPETNPPPPTPGQSFGNSSGSPDSGSSGEDPNGDGVIGP